MMKERGRVVLSVVMLLAAAGCQTSVHQVRLERVDQSLEGGNRGYLVGTPPELAGRGTPTREITEVEIQWPTGARRTPAKRRAAPAPAAATPSTEDAEAQAVATGTSFADQAAAPELGAPAMTRYTVKKGDSLWKIAKKFYGDPYQWRRIYDANRAQLPHPNRVRPGMTLNMPGGAPSARRTHTRRPSPQDVAPASDLK